MSSSEEKLKDMSVEDDEPKCDSRVIVSPKRMTCKYYKRTRAEALTCENIVPTHELFDLETGYMKEEYLKNRSPSPPTGTIVFEVGSGRAYEFVRGTSMRRIHPDSAAMTKVRQDAKRAKREHDEKDQDDGKPGAVSSGGLRRVIPLSAECSADFKNISSSSIVSGEQPTAFEKVMLWKTSTPDQLDILGSKESALDVAQSAASKDFQSGLCDCVTLVTSENVCIEMQKPAFADIFMDDWDSEEYPMIVESPTLYHLWNGYHNYVVSKSSDGVHRMEAYSCRSPRSKVFNAYKSILCNPPVSVVSHSPVMAAGGSSGETFYNLMAFINQYMNVFSALTDFNYTWLPPALKGGMCNAIIVDKVYLYNASRQIYLPSYRLLEGDRFTDFVVSEIQKLNNRGTRIKHLRFISTVKTLLYTNRPTLARRSQGYSDHPKKRVSQPDTEAEDQRRTRIDQPSTSAEGSDAAAAFLPFKKRLVEHEVGDLKSSTSGSREPPHIDRYSPPFGSYELNANDWPDLKHRAGCSKGSVYEPTFTELSVDTDVLRSCHEPSKTAETQWPKGEAGTAGKKDATKNPTLIVFKHSLDNTQRDTLLCNIIVEMHLGNKMRY